MSAPPTAASATLRSATAPSRLTWSMIILSVVPAAISNTSTSAAMVRSGPTTRFGSHAPTRIRVVRSAATSSSSAMVQGWAPRRTMPVPTVIVLASERRSSSIAGRWPSSIIRIISRRSSSFPSGWWRTTTTVIVWRLGRRTTVMPVPVVPARIRLPSTISCISVHLAFSSTTSVASGPRWRIPLRVARIISSSWAVCTVGLSLTGTGTVRRRVGVLGRLLTARYYCRSSIDGWRCRYYGRGSFAFFTATTCLAFTIVGWCLVCPSPLLQFLAETLLFRLERRGLALWGIITTITTTAFNHHMKRRDIPGKDNEHKMKSSQGTNYRTVAV